MNSEMLRELAEPYMELGINMREHHLPVPERHRPNVREVENHGSVGIVLHESFKDVRIHCENPVEVLQ